MLSTDRPLFNTRCSILARGSNWVEKQVLVIQNAILLYDRVQSFYDPEIFKMSASELYSFPVKVEAEKEKDAEAKDSTPKNEKFLIKIVQSLSKKAKLMSFFTKKEADAFQTAIIASNNYAFYETCCINTRLEPHSYILKYTLELVQQASAPFYFKESFLAEDFFPPIYEYLKRNKLIEHIVFQDLILDAKKTNTILQIITNFPKTQISHLVFTNNGLTDALFEHLLYGFGHQAYLECLEISSNLLTDNALVYLTAILEYMPSLYHLNISGNQITGFQDFDTFLEAILRDLELEILDLSSNKLKDSTIDLLISYIFKQPDLSIKEFNLSRNNFSSLGHHKIIDSYYRCSNKENMKLILKPLPFHSSVLQRLVTQNTNIDITIERISLNNLAKRPPTKAVELKNISELLVKISEIKGSSITVEEISRICNKIYHLEYEFPPQKLELLHYVLRKKIQQALGESNYYATDVLLQSAEQVGLGIQEFEDEVKYIKIKVNKLVSDLIEILNFHTIETNINEILDARLKEALSLGMRGHLIDTLLSLKEKRDEIIKNYDKEGYEDDVDDDDENPFSVLTRDNEYANIKGSIEIDLMRFDKPLLLHPMQVNYYQLSKMEIPKINEALQTAGQKLEEDENYYVRNAYNRCYFILLASIENTRTVARRDKKLYNCRLIIQYRNYVHKKIEKPVPYPDLVFPIEKVEEPENVQELVEQYRMESFPYLYTIEDLVKKFKKKFLEQTQASERNEKLEKMEKKDNSLSLTKLVSFKDFGSRKEQTVKSTPRESFSFKVPNSMLEFSMTPTNYSLVNFTNLDAEPYALMINSLVLTIFSIDRNEPEFQTAIQTLIKAVQEQDPSKYYELNDEMYLQFYKVANRETIPLTKFFQQNVFSALAVISNFIQPEPELLPYVKGWLYSLANHPDLSHYINRILINLANNELPDFKRIYWIPSRQEIRDLIKYENKIVVEVRFQTGNPPAKSFTIPYNATVRQLMEQVYSSPQLNQLIDKYTFWLFKSSEATKSQGDIALFHETIVAQAISTWADTANVYTLFVKRRIFSSVFTLNYCTLEKSYLDSLYEDVFSKYAYSLAFGGYLKIDAIVKTTALLFLIRQKKKGHDKVDISRQKVSKKIQSLIPHSYLVKKTEDEWVERIATSLSYNVKWQELDFQGLYQEFLSIFINSPLFAASYFLYKKKDNIGDRTIPIDGVFCVNVFGIFFFSQTNRDKPSFCMRFEELSYVIGYDTICKICYVDKKFGVEVQTTLETSRARELTEDVISYASIRNLEKTYVFYSFSIIRDFEKVYINRRAATRNETDLVLGEELSLKMEEAVEANEIVRIPDPSLAFHEKLPFFDYSKAESKRAVRKIQREAPIQEETNTAPSIELVDPHDTNKVRRNSFSEHRRSNLDPSHMPVLKEEKKNIFTSIFKGSSDDPDHKLGHNPVKWAAGTFMGIFRQKEKAQSHLQGQSSRDKKKRRNIPPIDTEKSGKATSRSNLSRRDSYGDTSLDFDQSEQKSPLSQRQSPSPLSERRVLGEEFFRRDSKRRSTGPIEDQSMSPDKDISFDDAGRIEDEELDQVEILKDYHSNRSSNPEKLKNHHDKPEGPETVETGPRGRKSVIAVVREATEDAEGDSKPTTPRQFNPQYDKSMSKGVEAMRNIVKKQVIIRAFNKKTNDVEDEEEESDNDGSLENEEDGGVRKMMEVRKRSNAVYSRESPFKGLVPKVREFHYSFEEQSVDLNTGHRGSDRKQAGKKTSNASDKNMDETKRNLRDSSHSRSGSADKKTNAAKTQALLKELTSEISNKEKGKSDEGSKEEKVNNIQSSQTNSKSQEINAVKSRVIRKRSSESGSGSGDGDDDEENDQEEKRRAKAKQALNFQKPGVHTAILQAKKEIIPTQTSEPEEKKMNTLESSTSKPTITQSTENNTAIRRAVKFENSDEEDESEEDDQEERRRAKTRLLINPQQIALNKTAQSDREKIEAKGIEQFLINQNSYLKPPSLHDKIEDSDKSDVSPADFSFIMHQKEELADESKSVIDKRNNARRVNNNSESNTNSSNESDDKEEKRRMNKKPAFNPYQKVSSVSQPEPVKDTKGPIKESEIPAGKDTSLLSRIAKKNKDSDEDEDEDEDDEKEERRAEKLPMFNPYKVQVQSLGKEETEKAPTEKRQSITNKSIQLEVSGNQVIKEEKKEEEEEVVKKEETGGIYQSALKKALSGALKSIPKAKKIEKPLTEDELFYKTDDYREPMESKKNKVNEVVKEKVEETVSRAEVKAKQEPEVKQVQVAQKVENLLPEVKQPQAVQKIEKQLPEVKQTQLVQKTEEPPTQAKPEEKKIESKDKLGKALFGALKSMPKTKKVEKQISEDDRFFNH